MAGATILNVVYGMDIGSGGDEYLDIAEKAVHIISIIASTGAYLGKSCKWYCARHLPDIPITVDVLPIRECQSLLQ